MTALESAAEYVLHCRDEGHTWRHVTDVVTEQRGRVKEYTQVRSCEMCGTIRRRTIGVPGFDIVATRYEYHDDYLIQQRGRISRADVRREAFMRATTVVQ